jgi:hypothetical protein
MKKAILIIAMLSSFFAIFPLSWRLVDPFFSKPFDERFLDPILLVCPNYVEILYWHDLADEQYSSVKAVCTFQIGPTSQAWVENAVKHLPSPAPAKSSWHLSVKQLQADHQQVTLELFGDGFLGMVYDVHQGKVTPLKSRITGPGGALVALGMDICLWATLWGLFGLAWIVVSRTRNRRTAPPSPPPAI